MSAQNLVEFHRFFFTPVWRFQYPDWDNESEIFIKYLLRDNLYLNERERNNLVITRANLHKEPAMKRITEFIHSSCEDAMEILGFEKSCGITSMWATKQKPGGFHHRHFHANAFLGASMAIFDSDGNSSGTVFDNMDIHKYGLHPAVNKERRQILPPSEFLHFHPGSLLVFPAWAVHHTMPNSSNKRINIGANIMPVGKTNHDHFDRYNFPDPATLDMKEYE
jgi:hypothetical protein